MKKGYLKKNKGSANIKKKKDCLGIKMTKEKSKKEIRKEVKKERKKEKGRKLEG